MGLEDFLGDFEGCFSSLPEVVVAAPGRVNLIGEHTDYNLGLALPAAIDRKVLVGVSRRSDELMVLRAFEEEGFEGSVLEVAPLSGMWHNYVRGIVGLLSDGFGGVGGVGNGALGGFNLYVRGDIPVGAGMSSSAALCCGVVMALDALFALGMDRKAMALVAQRAEHEFAGVACGLMDQLACLFGKAGHAMLLDFASMEMELVEVDLRGASLVLLDTGVKHSLAASEYNLRREECLRALALVGNGASSLRGVLMDELVERVKGVDGVAYDRAKFVLEENVRVLAARDMLASGNMAALGDLMLSSHRGLSRYYGVSCAELDFLVEHASLLPSLLGARMMGGGFGGCTINLVQGDVAEFVATLSDGYQQEFGRQLMAHPVSLSEGAMIVYEGIGVSEGVSGN
jgi:galactokinase